jgi:hypothetical protein
MNELDEKHINWGVVLFDVCVFALGIYIFNHFIPICLFVKFLIGG